MNLLILGANSDVAHAVAKKFARQEKADLYLASRDMDLLQKKAQDLEIRHGISARALFFDALQFESHRDFYHSLAPKPDGVVAAFGLLGDEPAARKDFGAAKKIIETNFLGALSILEVVAEDFEKRGTGFIIGISSVAGDRGRQSNYFYGAAKGAFTTYLSGLRNRLGRSAVLVMTVLPGFIRTKMTDHLKLPQLLAATPEQVADDIYSAFKKKKEIIYTKWFWRWIMAVIRMIPEPIFKRMNL